MTKSPTVRLLLGLLITLAAVTGFSTIALHELTSLRRLQTDLIDLNRNDSLQLLQLQNDLNTVDLKVRDLTWNRDRSSIEQYRDEFDSLRLDLNRALNQEARIETGPLRSQQRIKLLASFARFWNNLDSVFDAAEAGKDEKAQRLAESLLIPEQADLATQVSIMLERNNQMEVALDQRVSAIYNGAARDIYGFEAGTMLAIAGTSLYLIYSNRKFFEQLESLSRQRRVLAARLITVQEEVLRSVSRELHDEFGQILTAVGAMLARAEKRGVPPDSPLRTELSEVRQITHNTLEKIRSLSQMLHPAIIDDFGLAKAVEWYTGIFEKQTGIETETVVSGAPVRITGQPAIHCFRIVQEALNNAAKHSGSKRAEVRLVFSAGLLTVSVTDFGRGLTPPKDSNVNGLGLIAMRERTELLGGILDISSNASTGTTVSVTMPLKHDDAIQENSLAQNTDHVLAGEL